ncbi:MAG: RNA polymerase sigma factor [Gemmatimonadota bacterium]|nr:MAG: RNA polymerase sigma factor [Gemmatimonadota bacterium]
MSEAVWPAPREVLSFRAMAERIPGPGKPTADSDEAALVRGIVDSDAEIVAEFLRRTHGPVYRIASRLTADPEARSDWSHETLLGVLDDVRRGRFEYRGPGSLWGWFRKRAYFRVLDQYRKAKLNAERERPSGAGPDFSELAELGAGSDPLEELERVRLRAALESCLARIANENHRRALECLLFRDMAYEPIAVELDTPLNTVRAWIRRGRLLLRKCLVKSLGLLDSASPPKPAPPEGNT